MYNELVKRTITGISIGIIVGSIYLYLPPIFFSLFLCILLALILLYEMPRLLDYTKWYSWLFSLLYPITPFCMLILLNSTTEYHFLVFLIFILTFANDVGAYFMGKYCGKHKLCPRISPKKTWEGFFGGTTFVFLIIIILLFFKQCTIKIVSALFFSILVAFIATIGDLFESWLKRKAGVKDSGDLLPGHGGLLDRFDSILAVAIVVYFCRSYFLNLFCK
jgi:phosphatidate cytidylyltransferase